MAAGDTWAYNVTSTATTTTYPLQLTGGTWTGPVTVYSSGGSTMPAPRPQTALEWLDAEIEAVCKLARAG